MTSAHASVRCSILVFTDIPGSAAAGRSGQTTHPPEIYHDSVRKESQLEIEKQPQPVIQCRTRAVDLSMTLFHLGPGVPHVYVINCVTDDAPDDGSERRRKMMISDLWRYWMAPFHHEPGAMTSLSKLMTLVVMIGKWIFINNQQQKSRKTYTQEVTLTKKQKEDKSRLKTNLINYSRSVENT